MGLTGRSIVFLLYNEQYVADLSTSTAHIEEELLKLNQHAIQQIACPQNGTK